MPKTIQSKPGETGSHRWRIILGRPVFRWLFLPGLSILGLFGLLFWLATRTPAFYLQRLNPPEQGWENAAYEFERHALELSNAARRTGRWHFELDDSLINGWLVADMPKKFPHQLPELFAEPRVAFLDETIAVGVQVNTWIGPLVAHVHFRPHCGQGANELTLELTRSCVGWLPLPNRLWRMAFAESLRSQGMTTTWIATGPQPVLVIRLPDGMTTNEQCRWELETIAIAGGALTITGSTRRRDAAR